MPLSTVIGTGNYQGNAPWVAPACADCPGFLVLGSAPAPTATLVSEPQIVPLASAFFAVRALGDCLDLLPAAPPPPCKNGTHSTWFYSTGGHTPRKRGHYERGLFTGGLSRISEVSKFSRISRKWSDSSLFPESGASLKSLESLYSLESLNGLF